MSYIDDLVAAYRAEFESEPEVSFSPGIPAQFTPPQVVVTPGDPFLVPKDMNTTVQERWAVLVVVSMDNREAGISQLRTMSMRAFRATIAAGAVWEQATGPQVPESNPTGNLVIVTNEVRFQYPITDQLPPEE